MSESLQKMVQLDKSRALAVPGKIADTLDRGWTWRDGRNLAMIVAMGRCGGSLKIVNGFSSLRRRQIEKDIDRRLLPLYNFILRINDTME